GPLVLWGNRTPLQQDQVFAAGPIAMGVLRLDHLHDADACTSVQLSICALGGTRVLFTCALPAQALQMERIVGGCSDTCPRRMVPASGEHIARGDDPPGAGPVLFGPGRPWRCEPWSSDLSVNWVAHLLRTSVSVGRMCGRSAYIREPNSKGSCNGNEKARFQAR